MNVILINTINIEETAADGEGVKERFAGGELGCVGWIKLLFCLATATDRSYFSHSATFDDVWINYYPQRLPVIKIITVVASTFDETV